MNYDHGIVVEKGLVQIEAIRTGKKLIIERQQEKVHTVTHR